MKKICFFTGHYGISQHMIITYYEKLFPKDVEMFMVCANKVDKEKYHFSRTRVFEFLDKKMVVPFKLRKFLRENEIDLLAGFGGQVEIAWVLFLSTAFTKIKNMFYFLGNPKIIPMNYFFLFSQFFTNKFVACCKEVSDKFKKFLFFSGKRIFYVPFPIDTNKFFLKNRNNLRKKLGFKEGEKILIYVGRIEFEQGSDYLLKLIEKNKDKTFILIGEMKDENFKDKHFKNLVHIPYLPNSKLPDYYNLADISLFLSKRNSYPYPPRESLACGTPVIVFNLDTFGQLTAKSAIKVPFDVEKIQCEIDNLLSLPNIEKKKLSEEGRQFIIEDSSEEKLKDRTLNLFFD